ncbi:MAG: BRO family protein, partial [Desulfobacterales bacterium]
DIDPWFVANEVAKALGYSNSRKAVSDHCRYVTKCDVPHPQSPNKVMEVNLIPESDVYRLIMRSNLPKAIEFQDWVVEDRL